LFWASAPLLLPAATTTTAMMAPAPISAKPARACCAIFTPAVRPGLSGPASGGRVAAATRVGASAAWAEGAANAKKVIAMTKVKNRIRSPVVP
jgi:hypothetical protein